MTLTIEKAVELYLDEKLHLGRITEPTARVQRTLLGLMVRRFGGDRDVASVTRVEARAWLAELIADGKRPLYANHVVATAAACFGWVARELEARQGNPFERLRATDRVAARERRLPFTDDDLRLVWPAVLRQRDPARRWVPELMLRLGLRPEEAAQLHRRDLVEAPGGLVLAIRAGAGQRLKNAASERDLPVLDALRPFAAWALAQPDGFLFECPAGIQGGQRNAPAYPGRGRHERVSNWFTETLRRGGIEDRRKVLYSLRHTVATRLADADVPHERIGALLGHTGLGMAAKVYIKRPSAWFHVEALRKLTLPEEIG